MCILPVLHKLEIISLTAFQRNKGGGESRILGTIAKIKSQGSHNSSKGDRKNLLKESAVALHQSIQRTKIGYPWEHTRISPKAAP